MWLLFGQLKQTSKIQQQIEIYNFVSILLYDLRSRTPIFQIQSNYYISLTYTKCTGKYLWYKGPTIVHLT